MKSTLIKYLYFLILFFISITSAKTINFGPFTTNIQDSPKIAFVFGGGGARGFSHIGILSVLEKNGIVPDLIVGTSMGAVVGGLYAAGYSAKDLETIMLDNNWKAIFSDVPDRRDLYFTQKDEQNNHILEFRLRKGNIVLPNALISGQNITNELFELSAGASLSSNGIFDSLETPFRAVTTDLLNGNRVVLKQGNLAEAIRASLGVPFAFTPFKIDDKMLIDGGFKGIVAIDIAKKWGADIIIAVDVKPELYKEDELQSPIKYIDQIVSIMLLGQEDDPYRDSAIVISPDLKGHTSGDFFHNIDKLVNAGKIAANKAMPIILKNIKSKKDSISATLDTMTNLDNKLGSISFVGNAVIKDDILRTLFAQNEFDICNPIECNKGIKRIRAEYVNRGYLLAFIDTIIWDKNNCKIKINEGLIASVSISGNINIKPSVILREMNIYTGGVFTKELGDKSIKNLFSLGLFQYVYFNVKKENGKLELQIVVKEKPLESFFISARYDIVRSGEIYLRYNYLNFLNLGSRFYTHLQYGSKREKYYLNYNSDHLFTTPFASSLRAYYYRDKKSIASDSSEYQLSLTTLRKIGIKGTLSQKFLRKGLFSYSYKWERYGKNDQSISIAEKPVGDFSYGLQTLALTYRYDSFDNIEFPKTGANLFAQYNVGLALSSSSNTSKGFSNIIITGAWAKELTKNYIIIPRFYSAFADANLPDPEQFYLGGATMLKMNDDLTFHNTFPLSGYGEQAFKGDLIIATAINIRRTLSSNSYLKLTFNGGQVWERLGENSFNLEEFKDDPLKSFRAAFYGVAASFEIAIPKVGPASFVVSKPLNFEENQMVVRDGKLGEFVYFSIGHNF